MNDRKLFLAYFDVARYTRDVDTQKWALDQVEMLLGIFFCASRHSPMRAARHVRW